jgi:hypothetical protein
MKITNERIKEIEVEAKRRLDLWLLNTSFQEMSCGGSYIRFHMALGLRGYPFGKRDWMADGDFNEFVSEKEFNSPQYDTIISKLFEIEYHAN